MRCTACLRLALQCALRRRSLLPLLLPPPRLREGQLLWTTRRERQYVFLHTQLRWSIWRPRLQTLGDSADPDLHGPRRTRCARRTTMIIMLYNQGKKPSATFGRQSVEPHPCATKELRSGKRGSAPAVGECLKPTPPSSSAITSGTSSTMTANAAVAHLDLHHNTWLLEFLGGEATTSGRYYDMFRNFQDAFDPLADTAKSEIRHIQRWHRRPSDAALRCPRSLCWPPWCWPPCGRLRLGPLRH